MIVEITVFRAWSFYWRMDCIFIVLNKELIKVLALMWRRWRDGPRLPDKNREAVSNP